jgi:hypothetical protein
VGVRSLDRFPACHRLCARLRTQAPPWLRRGALWPPGGDSRQPVLLAERVPRDARVDQLAWAAPGRRRGDSRHRGEVVLGWSKYCHRLGAGGVDAVWWVPAERPELSKGRRGRRRPVGVARLPGERQRRAGASARPRPGGRRDGRGDRRAGRGGQVRQRPSGLSAPSVTSAASHPSIIAFSSASEATSGTVTADTHEWVRHAAVEALAAGWADHSRAALSSLLVARLAPSGVKATDRTQSVCGRAQRARPPARWRSRNRRCPAI